MSIDEWWFSLSAVVAFGHYGEVGSLRNSIVSIAVSNLFKIDKMSHIRRSTFVNLHSSGIHLIIPVKFTGGDDVLHAPDSFFEILISSFNSAGRQVPGAGVAVIEFLFGLIFNGDDRSGLHQQCCN